MADLRSVAADSLRSAGQTTIVRYVWFRTISLAAKNMTIAILSTTKLPKFLGDSHPDEDSLFAEDDVLGSALAIVAKDDLKLWISGPQSSAARPMPDGRVAEPGGRSTRHASNRFVIAVDGIEAVVASMRQTGINFRNDIICGPGGKRIFAADVVRYSRLMHADEEARSGA